MNPNNRLQKIEAKLIAEDYCECFTKQIKIFTGKIYAGEACSAADNPGVPVSVNQICEICSKPQKNIFDAQTVKAINELYEEIEQ